MVKRENAITVDIVKAIVIRNYIKFGGHMKKLKWKFLWLARLGSDILRLRLKENTARLDWNFLWLSFCGFGCGSQVYLGPFVPWTVHSLELSFQVPWTFPAADHSFICQQSSTWSNYKEGTAFVFHWIFLYHWHFTSFYLSQ